ncbi:MAG: hypothetical protein KZQ58_12565 [gamma proteobacterium symbiont of Bathyaustriella thionipta]|nr:hypothetical protein [gamma proteobacterium symbiont of Bathyaustriella thionipta]
MTTDTENSSEENLPTIQKVISILWPSFVMAAFATIFFFTVFSPSELALIKGWTDVSNLAGYTIGFFLFWLLTALSCALTCFFRKPCTPKYYKNTDELDDAEE